MAFDATGFAQNLVRRFVPSASTKKSPKWSWRGWSGSAIKQSAILSVGCPVRQLVRSSKVAQELGIELAITNPSPNPSRTLR